jgi:protein-disulfide isomerase
MQKKSAPQSGFFNPRNCLALLLCLGAVSIAVLSFAVPASSSGTTNSSYSLTSTLRMPFSTTSPVIITEFSDFQCPYCKRAASVIEQVRQTYGQHVKVVFKQLPLRMHRYAFKAAQASVCAQEQGKFWQYHDRLFASSDLSLDALNRIAAEVGLKQNKFNECMASDSSRAAVEKDVAEADRLGVSGTPTFFVNGSVVKGGTSFATLKQEIDGTMLGLHHPIATAVRRPADVWQFLPKDGIGSTLGLMQKAAQHTATTSTMTVEGVTLSPASIDFGYFLLGTGFPQAQEIVTNSGTDPLVITDISISGHDRGNFEATYGFQLPVTVAPGQSMAINISFTPSSVGARQARLEISERRSSQYVSLSGKATTCVGPFPACNWPQCPATDGDGLNDAWKLAGGIDFNGDGLVDASEKVLTNVDPIFPDGTPNSHPSAERGVKDVFVLYDWMELPDQLTNGQPTACTVNPPPHSGPPDNFQFFYPYHSDQCAFDQACINGFCRGHSDAPDGTALKMVIDAFAGHNIRLHLIEGHALPHANVVSYGAPRAACIADTSAQTFSGTQAISFDELQAANFNASYNGQSFAEAQLLPVMHYAIFGHRHTCDSFEDCAQASCFNPVNPDERPFFNATGYSEKPGHAIVVSEGYFRDRNIVRPALAQGGTFMHELGHNLGLDHGGPLYIVSNPTDYRFGYSPTDYGQVKLNYKPNYISVMNYNHEDVGISTASPNCAPDDYVCKTTPVSTRLDYSSFVNGVPNTLDENNGSEAAGLNLGNNDIGYTHCPVATPIPGTGPVDFNCDGTRNQTWCESGCDITPGIELNQDPLGGGQIPNGTPGSGDVLRPFEDWPNLIFDFQCFHF